MKEQEFNFSKELEIWWAKWFRKRVIGRCLAELKQRDKEFIRLLKRLNSIAINDNLMKEIDKLVGYVNQDLCEEGGEDDN